MYMYINLYISIYICMYIDIYICIYMYIIPRVCSGLLVGVEGAAQNLALLPSVSLAILFLRLGELACLAPHAFSPNRACVNMVCV